MVNQNSNALVRETFAFMPKIIGQAHVAAIALAYDFSFPLAKWVSIPHPR
jgi:hypothetical protein